MNGWNDEWGNAMIKSWNRMKKNIFAIYVIAVGCTALTTQTKNTQTLIPFTERVNMQSDSAHVNQIIDDCWVTVGTKSLPLMRFNATSRVCLTANLPIALNWRKRIIHCRDMSKGRLKNVRNSLIVMPLLMISKSSYRYLSESADNQNRIPSWGKYLSAGSFPQLWVFSTYPFFIRQQCLHYLRSITWNAGSHISTDSAGRNEESDDCEFVELEKTTILKKNVGHKK